MTRSFDRKPPNCYFGKRGREAFIFLNKDEWFFSQDGSLVLSDTPILSSWETSNILDAQGSWDTNKEVTVSVEQKTSTCSNDGNYTPEV